MHKFSCTKLEDNDKDAASHLLRLAFLLCKGYIGNSSGNDTDIDTGIASKD